MPYLPEMFAGAELGTFEAFNLKKSYFPLQRQGGQGSAAVLGKKIPGREAMLFRGSKNDESCRMDLQD